MTEHTGPGPRLAGKIAIVTGGSSGIGAETVRQFAAHGATVVVCDVDAAGGQAVAEAVNSGGGEALFRALDVADESQWEALVGEVVERFGRLDVLANIAGVSGREPGSPVENPDGSVGARVTEQTLESWNRIMDINSTGTFLGTKHAARAMRANGGGSIVNISSICGLIGSYSSAPYHASKGAVRLLTKAAAIQCAADKVRVNSIHPGFVDTPMTRPAHANNAVARERMDATPLGRFGTPHDIAMGCVYLASDEAAWVTGSELVIDGGVVASDPPFAVSDSAHVMIVGAGIVGVSTAIWLARAGRQVTLVDREGPAAGTSFGNAGILAASSVVPVPVPGIVSAAPGMLFNPDKPLFLRWTYLPRLLPWLFRYLRNADAAAVERISAGLTALLHDTTEQHLALARGTPAEAFIDVGDYLYGYRDAGAFEADAFAWNLRRRRGFAFTALTADEAGAYDPALAGRFGCVVRCPNHGFISDPGAYVHALFEQFVELGGTYKQADVTGIDVRDGRARGVVTADGMLAADVVVVTTGAWSAPLARQLGVTVGLESERGYHLEFVNPSVQLRRPLAVAAGKFVLTPMRGRLRAAGVVEFGGLDAGPSEAPFALLERQTRALMPELRYDGIERWMGHRPATVDSLPVIGAAPHAANVYVGYGHQHVGLTGGPRTGRWLAQLIAGETPNVDLAPFSPAR